jgi:hypothetical protein
MVTMRSDVPEGVTKRQADESQISAISRSVRANSPELCDALDRKGGPCYFADCT